MDPEVSTIPHQSPYASYDNNPILNEDPFGNCTKCPKDGNYEGRQHTTDAGAQLVYSNETWTPAAEFENWKVDSASGQTDVGYFDYYAGKHGYDPTREDWGNEAGQTHLKNIVYYAYKI